MWVCLWRSEEDVRCFEAEVTDSCEPADLGTDISSSGRATMESTLHIPNTDFYREILFMVSMK